MRRSILNSIAPTHHDWDARGVKIHVRSIADGRERQFSIPLDFTALKIPREGLLEAVIRDAPSPLVAKTVYEFKRAILSLAKHEHLRDILGTKPNRLTEADIVSIAAYIDEDVLHWGNDNTYEKFINTWKIFKYCTTEISTGQKISEINYKSELNKYERNKAYLKSHVKKLISDCFDESFSDPEISAPISALHYDEPNEQSAAAEQHLKARLDRIESACMSVVHQHLEISDYLTATALRGLPESLSRRARRTLRSGGYSHISTLEKLPPEDRLRVYLYIFERDEWYKHRPHLSGVRLKDHQVLSNAVARRTPQALGELLYSRHYLPGHVVTACLVVIGIETAWNKDTLLNLAPEDVRKTNYGYDIASIKKKTDKIQGTVIPEIDQEKSNELGVWELRTSSAKACMDLLMQNAICIRKYGNCEANSLFLVPGTGYSGKPFFRLPYLYPALKELSEHARIKYFSLKQLRDQVTAYGYLSSGFDVEYVRMLCGHINIQTTEGYLATTILNALHTANIARFCTILEKSVLFATGRMSLTDDAHDPTECKVIKRLLFPISAFGDDMMECTVDQWIKSGGKEQILLTKDEIEHCALQRQYYIGSTQHLLQANSQRFLRHHLPRIVVCYALYRLIESSVYRSILRRYEESLNV